MRSVQHSKLIELIEQKGEKRPLEKKIILLKIALLE
jgi:hypothetical protein